jgi:hypothetical protein
VPFVGSNLRLSLGIDLLLYAEGQGRIAIAIRLFNANLNEKHNIEGYGNILLLRLGYSGFFGEFRNWSLH